MAYCLAILGALIVCSLWTSWYEFNYTKTFDNKSLVDNFYILNEHFVVLSRDTDVTYVFFLIIINYVMTKKGDKRKDLP